MPEPGNRIEVRAAPTGPRVPETLAAPGRTSARGDRPAAAYLRAIAAIVRKDLAAELRSRELLGGMLVFSLLLILIFNFALELDARTRQTVTAGVLWSTFAFAGTLGLNRSMALEVDRGCLDGLLLAPVDRSALFFGKALGNLIFMLVALFFLGFFLEWIEISYIVMPLFVPIFRDAGVDMVWMAILVGMTLQTTFLTPPVGWSLFFLKGVAPPGISTRDIYVGIIPFVLIQLAALVVLWFLPGLATWLPHALYGR